MAREVPQYISQLNISSAPKIQYSMAGAEATQRVSAQLGVMAEDTAKKSAELGALRTETAYKENLHRIYNENRANPDGFNKSYDGFYKQFRGKLPNTEFTQKLDVQHNLFAQSYRDKIMEQYSSNVEDDYKAEQLKTLQVNHGLRAESAKGLLSNVPETRETAFKQLQMLNDQDAEIYSSKDYKGSARYSPEAQVKGLVENGKIMFEALPAEKRLEVLGDTEGGFASAQALVIKHEGGYNPVDGNTGHPALFAINRKWHPEGYAAVEAVYKSKGAAAGQQAADAYLKKTFWDVNDIGSLNPRVQGIVYDGAVNHRSEFVRELVASAKAGASPGDLLDMRQREYDRLEKSGKYSKADVASWNNRLNDYQHLAITDYEKYIDPDTKESLLKAARSEIELEIKMWRDNAPKAAMLAGARTAEDIAKPQLERGVPKPYVRMIDNEGAETLAQRINQAQSTDDVMNFASELQQTYGEMTSNAIRDLKEKGKMKPEMEGALGLAATGNPTYKEHIDLLTQAGASGETVINEVFAANQYKANELNAKIAKESLEWQRAVQNEGWGLVDIQEKMQTATSLAKAKMNKTLDGDYGDAVDFALKPNNDMYALREISGGWLRIPTAFSADAVEDGLDDLMDNKLPGLVEGSKDKDYVYSKSVSPFLSPLEDGVMFRTPMGEVVHDAKGAVIEFKLKDLAGHKKVRPKGDFKPIPKGMM